MALVFADQAWICNTWYEWWLSHLETFLSGCELKNSFSSEICPFFASHLSYLLHFHSKVRKTVPLYFCFGRGRRQTNYTMDTYFLILILIPILIPILPLSLTLSFSFLLIPSPVASIHPSIRFFIRSFPPSLHSALDTSAAREKESQVGSSIKIFTLHSYTWLASLISPRCCLWHSVSVKGRRKTKGPFPFFLSLISLPHPTHKLVWHLERTHLGHSLHTHIELCYCFHVKFQRLLWHFWWWKRGPVVPFHSPLSLHRRHCRPWVCVFVQEKNNNKKALFFPPFPLFPLFSL